MIAEMFIAELHSCADIFKNHFAFIHFNCQKLCLISILNNIYNFVDSNKLAEGWESICI